MGASIRPSNVALDVLIQGIDAKYDRIVTSAMVGSKIGRSRLTLLIRRFW